ncbi:Carbohydrate kinase [Candidatus Methylobacter favarea]|uniref:Carbohydrate kinase n=1 Tax=Candidatus Methylobacter favarea TaxID=2707345 RepID=A0A8S0X8D8_9GAMM|nr:FGGY family carbohydrate kinase [Candidatus Methylobacter favarea]CAA9891030.1 Carbohydrate kinase [Candidatus Methylobacter favarea]
MANSLTQTIALDLGSTSIKAGLLNNHGEFNTVLSLPAPVISGENGRYESDGLAYLKTASQLLEICLADAGSHARLGLCCQRSSFLIWEKAGGLPVTSLISWQDSRGEASCEALKAKESTIIELTGLRLAPYYFAPKVRQLLQQYPEWRIGLEQGSLLIGTLDTFLIWRWSGGKYYQTDVSMAARTLLMDIHSGDWSQRLCGLFAIPSPILPKIKPSCGLLLPLNNNCLLNASVADQSAALIAAIKPESAAALVNLGTGGFVIRYIPDQDKIPTEGYLKTLIYQDIALTSHLAIEGTLNSIAAALAPYPFRQCRLEDLAKIEQLFCIPEPDGMGAPYFHKHAGIVFSSSVEHLNPHEIACLLLEGIIFRVTKILEDFHQLYGIERVYLSGGLSELSTLQQGIAIASCSSFEVRHLLQKDASLQGAAILAAVLPPACRSKSVKVQATPHTKAIRNKYERWKLWFEAYLGS